MSQTSTEGTIDRRQLARSPLVRVLWQLKFTADANLRDGREALAFRDAVGRNLSLDPLQLDDDATDVAGLAWKMVADDEQTQITLSTDTLTLETNEYGSWDDRFAPWVEAVTAALEETLKPGLRTRVGLRYLNVLFGAVFGRDDIFDVSGFSGLVAAPLLGFGVEAPTGVGLDMIRGRELLSVDGASAALNHTIITAEDDEIGMLVDVDSYFDNTAAFDGADIVRASSHLHDVGLKVFQMCVTDEAWQAMGPGELAEEGGES